MSIDKSPILVDTHPTKDLDVYRTFLNFDASRDKETITIYYSEHLLSNGIPVEVKSPLHYVIKNLHPGDIANDPDNPIEEEFLGFDSWFYFDTGSIETIVGNINLTLQDIPLDAPNGWIITQPL